MRAETKQHTDHTRDWRDWLPVAGMLATVLFLGLASLPSETVLGRPGKVIGLTAFGISAFVFGE